MYAADVPPNTTFYHGTKADLAVGELIRPGFGSNFVERELKHIYFSATLEAATWGAELARGPKGQEGARGRIYIVEPTGPFEDDPNLTDKKFPGNVTASYRSQHPLRITGEVDDWVEHSPERLQEMRDNLAKLNANGAAEIIED
ncbi:NAD(+)--rifampin ADP-ribosyltransferase [Sphingomonas sp. URHD0057]|uniref:NAD(+)--rifampin ADP-ribosyltransferase n=1 Tax=Sphingomonas sp. URHD0057 TaxID=1380389 RepID=UPI00049212D3|nr:NAD(+)--rifampin ADP-ribosyltransferase [Sphingomonas sp. URHD0057]